MELKDIKDLMRSFDKSGITKLKVKNDGFSIEMQKGSIAKEDGVEVLSVQSPNSSAQPIVQKIEMQQTDSNESKTKVKTINSPMVGTFYRAPSPDAAPYVEVGSVVKKGEVVAIVEAMKIMNELESEFDCKILKVLVEDGQPVEYDMPLFEVEI